eukprot:15362963-Ditylum_brightwellii.AAC.1
MPDMVKLEESALIEILPPPLAQTFDSLIPFLPEEVVDILICKPILSVVIPSHLNLLPANLNGPLSQKNLIEVLGTISALSQSVSILRSCFSMIEQQSVMQAIETNNWNDVHSAADNAGLMLPNDDKSANVPSSTNISSDLHHRLKASRLTMLSEVGCLVCCLISS